MEYPPKEKISMIIGLILLGVLNGEAGSRVLYGLLGDHLRKNSKRPEQDMVSEQAFRSALSRLKKQGIIESGGRGSWRLTKEGRNLARQGEEKQRSYERVRSLSLAERNTIVIFDVPESKRKLRDYLRAELVSLGYEQLQKSVWIGGGPLPVAFMDFVKEGGIVDMMHVFTIERRGTIAG